MKTTPHSQLGLALLLPILLSIGCASSAPEPEDHTTIEETTVQDEGLIEAEVREVEERARRLEADDRGESPPHIESTEDPPGDATIMDVPPEGELSEEEIAEVMGDPCKVRSPNDEPRLEHFRREVFETVCEAAQWFDGFFGSQRFDEEARRTHGRVGLLLLYDDYEGFDVDGTLKVRVDFPNLESRVNAFLGRQDEGDYFAGSEDRLDFLPTFFEREGEQDWLLGLGYRRPGSDRSSFDLDAGIEAESPPDPFVRARYRYRWPLENDALLRVRPTVYWTNQRGVGYGSRIDYERPMGLRTLGRASGNIIFDDETEGGDWDAGLTFYHGFSNDRAVSLYAGIEGETERDVPIKTYGTRVTFRQRMLREWFFGELVGGVTWPKDDPLQKREAAWHFGFGFEIFFSGEDLGLGR